MELIDGIKSRRSIRQFENRPVERAVIEAVVEAAAFAPSWKNGQIARYLVVDDPATIARLATPACMLGFAHNADIVAKAPAVLLLTVVTERSGYEKDGRFSTPKGDRWEMFDAGIAAQTFCLAAHEKGLGTVIMGIFDENRIAKVVDIPAGQRLAAVIPLGYPAGEPTAPPRKAAAELVSFV